MSNKMNMQISLGRALHVWEAETNKWILDKKTTQATQLVLLISPSPPSLGLCLLACPSVPSQGVHSEGVDELGLGWIFPLRSPIPVAAATSPSGGVTG